MPATVLVPLLDNKECPVILLCKTDQELQPPVINATRRILCQQSFLGHQNVLLDKPILLASLRSLASIIFTQCLRPSAVELSYELEPVQYSLIMTPS